FLTQSLRSRDMPILQSPFSSIPYPHGALATAASETMSSSKAQRATALSHTAALPVDGA
ncbi:Uncharacterized protein FKW44_016850, partial [Caligus rogercresseyi]